MQRAGYVHSIDEAVARVKAAPDDTEGFSFVGDATIIRYQTLADCDLKMVGKEIAPNPYAIALQKGSPLKDAFNDAYVSTITSNN